jgi:hypothetical protein
MVALGQSDAYIAGYFDTTEVVIQKVRSKNRILRQLRSTAEKVKPSPKIKKQAKSENIHGFNSHEEKVSRREQAKSALKQAKQRETTTKQRSLRINAKTTVLVPANTNAAEYIKNYKKRTGL